MQAQRDEEGAAEEVQEAQRINRALEQHVQELEAAQQEQAKNAAVSAEDADGTPFNSYCHACLLSLLTAAVLMQHAAVSAENTDGGLIHSHCHARLLQPCKP